MYEPIFIPIDETSLSMRMIELKAAGGMRPATDPRGEDS